MELGWNYASQQRCSRGNALSAFPSTVVFVASLTLPELYRDDHYVAVVKPSGLIVHRNPNIREPAALQIVRDQVQCHVWPIHRLDRGTYGVLVFGLSRMAASDLSKAFVTGPPAIHKRYWAVVRGHPRFEGLLDYPLLDRERNILQAARTSIRVLQTTELPFPAGRYETARYALVELEPHTGRTHQLRRHMAHLRHPIIGDVRHGDGHQNRAFRTHMKIHRLLLFAWELQFIHPYTGARIRLTANLDEETNDLLERLRLRPHDMA